MRRTIWIAGLAGWCALSAWLAASLPLSASRGFAGVTNLPCTHCHTHRDPRKMSAQDLTECGRKAQEFLRRKGYPADERQRKPSDYQKIADFSCGH